VIAEPRPWRGIAAALVSLTLVIGCSTGEPTLAPSGATPSGVPRSTPDLAPTPPPTRGPIALDGVALAQCSVPDAAGGVRAWCGELRVPEARSKPGGRQIALHVAVIPAATDRPAPDPVFFLAGGPGGAATATLGWVATTFRGIHATRDIVLVDQRGTGLSNAMQFDVPPDLGDLSPSARASELKRFITAQFARFDADPAMYTTAPAMDDLDAVRVALGYDKINLWGGSYGATAAQYYIRQHGEHVRAVVLDGGTLIDVPIFELIAPNSQRALDLLVARCEADAACGVAYPDLAGDLKRAWARLAKGPVTTDVTSTFTGKPIVVSTAGLASTIHAHLLGSDSAANLPWLIDAAGHGRWNDVAREIASLDQAPSGLLVMSGEIACSEAWARFDPGRTADLGAGSYLGPLEVDIATQQAVACSYAPPGYVLANDGQRARGDMPILLTVGNADPQDPPSNIATASTDFPNSLTVVVPNQGHTVSHLGCLPSIVDAFIVAGSAAGLDSTCAAISVAPAFKLPAD
jgi:pimeloyl-ACP methyl ester carboxylesterase